MAVRRTLDVPNSKAKCATSGGECRPYFNKNCRSQMTMNAICQLQKHNVSTRANRRNISRVSPRW